ncbi:hypothetical protein H6G76_29300 [Nostoc sp. FACHB-152]|uniref:hypothetical protein n=1 Tax=unclassified Nostoc TaxID=2593658 RepID=UPI001686364E|nr:MULTISPECIES: hypothetical protein [unclassified Nostoc]MBD2451155.1 hypothetical protein [Nostoc sp. FACHB-152]MBD2473351.1 hypothetical protein [Nostoc sp. FACHB-145]
MKLLETKQLNLTPIFLMGNAALLAMLFIIEIVNSAGLHTLANSKTPTLVELSSGESIRVSSISSYERSPQAITYFVGRTMTGLLSWNALPKVNDEYSPNPAKKLKIDPGVPTGENKITTPVWEHGFALSEDFRASFLKELGKLTPPDIFTGNTQSILKVNFISEPKKIKNGHWAVDMVADIIMFKQTDMVGEPISFNKTIYVRAIDTPTLGGLSSQYQAIANNIRASGLEITKIQDLELAK